MAETLRSRVRVLSSQSLVYGLSGTLTKLVGLIIVPILGSKFTPIAFAPIDLITAFASVIGSVILLGSDAAVAYYYFRETDEQGRQDLISTWMIFQFLLNAIVGAMLFIFAEPITRLILGPSSNSWYIRLTGCAFPLGSTVNYSLEILRLQIRPRRYVLVSGSSVIAGLFLTLLLVVSLNLGLVGIYIASLSSNILAFAISTYSLRRSIVPRFSPARFKQILAYGLPLVPISVSNWAIGLSNRFFIRAHSSQLATGLSDTGLFGMGNRIALLLMLAISAFALAWSPFALSISESPDAKRVYAKVLTFYVAVLSWLTLGLSLFAPLILTVVKPDYARSYQVVAPLAYAYAVAGAYPIVAMGTALSKKTIHLSWATIAAGICTLALNAILVPLPYMSLTGGAVATLCGNLMLVGLVYAVSQRLYPIPYEIRKVLTCAVLLAATVTLGQLLRVWLSPVSLTGIVVRLVALGIFPTALVIAGVIERYEVGVLYGALHSAVFRRRPIEQ
jgi:O-antigen/teichoic acid export membrane protein